MDKKEMLNRQYLWSSTSSRKDKRKFQNVNTKSCSDNCTIDDNLTNCASTSNSSMNVVENLVDDDDDDDFPEMGYYVLYDCSLTFVSSSTINQTNLVRNSTKSSTCNYSFKDWNRQGWDSSIKIRYNSNSIDDFSATTNEVNDDDNNDDKYQVKHDNKLENETQDEENRNAIDNCNHDDYNDSLQYKNIVEQLNKDDTTIHRKPQDCITCSLCQVTVSVLSNDTRYGKIDPSIDDDCTINVQIEIDTIPFFDGCIQNMLCTKCNSKRSDLSLLLGLLRFCQEVITIKKIYVRSVAVEGIFDTILTVTFQPYFEQPPDQYGKRSIYPHSSSCSKVRKKQLHPATQCLLAMIQSDWKIFEQLVLYNSNNYNDSNNSENNNYNYNVQIPAVEKQQPFSSYTIPARITLFPNRMSLEELYKQMPGQSKRKKQKLPRKMELLSSCQQQIKHPEKKVETIKSKLHIQSIPIDLIKNRIMPFLYAYSLHSFRCTCKFWFNVLSDCVPGFQQSIRLYPHQISSLRWMRKRESQSLTERDCMKYIHAFTNNTDDGEDNDDNDNDDDDRTDNDLHRSITGGRTVLLAIRSKRKVLVPSIATKSIQETDDCLEMSETSPYRQPNTNPLHENVDCMETRYIRLDQVTGRQVLGINETSAIQLNTNIARGGLLCDDPGLGKTITVLALILQTNGLSTFQHTTSESNSNSQKRKEQIQMQNIDDHRKKLKANDGTDVFAEYWRETVTAEFRIPALLKILNNLGKINDNDDFNVSILIAGLKRLISNENLGIDFTVFQEKVEQEIIDLCNNQGTDKTILFKFQGLVSEFKARQLRSAQKSFSNAKARPTSVVATLIEKQTRQELIDSLHPSSATLLVIPAVLLEHWQTQIKMHVDLHYFCGSIKTPLVFEYERKESQMEMNVAMAEYLIQVKRTHDPVIFFDKSGTRPLPSPQFLSMFRLVVTTTSRFMNEWNNGSFQSELQRKKNTIEEDEEDTAMYMQSEACPLLKIHWLRMVVDEGHSMGTSTKSSTIQFASWIQAQRRWAMTGTPTKQTNAQLSQILNLLNFLQHDCFSKHTGTIGWWKRNITSSWRDGELVSFYRLRSLLGFFLKRHTKTSLLEPPRYKVTGITMSPVEALTYNTLVSGIQANIVTTSMNGTTSGLQDSLLHESQSTNARLALANVRRVCIGWAHVVPTLTERNFLLTMELAEKFKVSNEAYTNIYHFLERAQKEELSECRCCGILVTILLLMPCCGEMVCTECMDSSTVECLFCDSQFNVDEFQKFQPGFSNTWKSNLENTPDYDAIGSVLMENPSPLSPRNDEGPIIRPKPDRRKTRKFGDGHECSYDYYFPDGRCIYCLEEHTSCNLMTDTSRCLTCHRCSQDCPEHESKSSYLVNRLLKLYNAPRSKGYKFGDSSLQAEPRPLKIIVFSQFRAALNVVGDRLLRKFGTASVAEYTGNHRSQSLRQFTFEPDCFCLLLTKDGSEGLDLSFVTHIFFLEEIYDQSVEDQAVARAWRMGAAGPVEIETLIASNTVEVAMRRYKSIKNDDDLLNDDVIDGVPTDSVYDTNGTPVRRITTEGQKLRSLLLSLRLIVDSHKPSLTRKAIEYSVSTTDKAIDESSLQNRRVRFILP